jgi:hypothetical protein
VLRSRSCWALHTGGEARFVVRGPGGVGLGVQAGGYAL